MTDVHNNVTSTANYMEFKTFTESLIDARLDTEKIKATRTPTAGASISTTCEGTDYHGSVDPLGHDRSVEVMEFVTQLLAPSNSTKDLPAPSLISVLTREANSSLAKMLRPPCIAA
jgi:hypothetical protein